MRLSLKNNLLLIFIQLLTLGPFCQMNAASDTIVIKAPIFGSDSINKKVQYWVDSSATLGIKEIQNRSERFISPQDSALQLKTTLESVRYNYWFRFTIRNDQSKDSAIYLLQCGILDTLELWVFQDTQLVKGYYALQGFLPTAFSKGINASASNIPTGKYNLPILIPPQETREVILRMRNTISFPNPKMNFILAHPEYEKLRRSITRWPFFVVNAGFGAILIFVALLSLYQFRRSKDQAHLFYAAYLISILIFFWYRLERSDTLPAIFSIYPQWYYLLEIPLTGIVFLFYVLFVLKFLGEQQQYFPLLFRWKKWIIGLIALYIVFFLLIGIFFGIYEFWKLYYTSQYLRFLFAAFFIGYILYNIIRIPKLLGNESQYLNLFLIGTLLLIFFGGLTTIGTYMLLKERFTGLWEVPLLPIQLGIIFDIFFYSLALIYREQLTIRENLSMKMGNLVNLLRPHFVGNALNNLEDLIYSDREQASEYIYILSALFENVVVHSQKPSVPIAVELDILKDYLEVQKVRFPQKFDYEIIVKEGTDPSKVQVPPMILQPHVENAIKHAFTKPYFTGQGRITIEVSSGLNGATIFSVEDNGIGREQQVVKRKSTGKGVLTTKGIIANYNRIFRTKLAFKIIDNKDRISGKAAGTKVILIIPNS